MILLLHVGLSCDLRCSYSKLPTSKSQKRELFRAITVKCLNNTPGRKEGEAWKDFIHRRCQRNPDTAKASTRTKARLESHKKTRKSRRSKKKPTVEEIEQRKELEQAKWCDDNVETKTDEVDTTATIEDEEWVFLDDEFSSCSSVNEFLDQLVLDGIDVENDSFLQTLLAETQRFSRITISNDNSGVLLRWR